MIYHRWAPSLGTFEDTPENVWGTTEYEGDRDEPTVFVGLYGFPDWYALWRHRGKKWIFWCGSDIRHLAEGYWMDENGTLRFERKSLCEWIQQNCESWVENEVEFQALKELGIDSQICPSFLGNINKFEVNYQWNERPKLYTSVSGDNFELYGWNKISQLAIDNPDIEFYLYGSDSYTERKTINVHICGRVSKEQMNEQIKEMQGALRLCEFEGFSEIVAKSLLMAQWPVSLIKYPNTIPLKELSVIRDKKEPNVTGRNYYRAILNQFPWNQKK